MWAWIALVACIGLSGALMLPVASTWLDIAHHVTPHGLP
jgi:hypothetical protein